MIAIMIIPIVYSCKDLMKQIVVAEMLALGIFYLI